MKISKQKLISILVVGMFLFSISIFSFQASNVRDNNENDEKIELLNVSYNFGDDYFNGTGTSLNVSLFGNRSETKALSINEEDLIISNEKNGWNMSEFKLNFSDIRAERKYVKFETRNDGSIEFIGTDRYYAMSFEIPNTCILKNLSIFLQYPGGKGPQGFQKGSSFNITVYNSTKESGILEPHYPIHQIEDDINFDLSDENVTQPAKWYQSDFDDRILNISKTHNNTFFAVFQSIEYPSGIFGSPSAYIYYAEEQESDEYNIIFHEGSGSTSNWSIINHQNGMFKVNLAPLNDTPTPQEINLTVFDTQVNKNGLYLNNSFFPHINNEYYIPINSPWFGNIEVNVSFEGKFRYDRKSISIFKATKDSGVTWNSSLEIQEYNNEFYNKSAKFYKPEYWSYGFVYKNTELYEDINNQSKFIELNNISNATWIISYTQVNNIISPNYLYSSNENNWEDFSDKEYINASNYINITSTFNNSNGDALLYIYLGSSAEADLKIQQDITNQNHNFPLWSFKSNTSISENDTLSEIRLMTNNGTMAGIVSKSISVILNKNQTDLIMTSNLKSSYVYGEELIIEALLKAGQTPIIGQKIHFRILETYSGGITNLVILNDTTNDNGIAQISYSIKDGAQSIKISVSYDGNVEYETSEFSSTIIPVRSVIEQFFIDFLPYLLILIGVMVGGAAYYTVRKYRYKKNMIIWREKTQKFADVLKIDLILVIHKNSGSALIQRSFSDIPIDGNLISGFLQAVSSFKYEIRQESEKSKKESILLDYQDYNILLKDGEFIRVALVLNSEPSKNLEKSLNDFIIDFEKQAHSDLKQFKGNVAPFKEYFGELVDKHFEMSFIRPHVINENPPTISLSSFQERVLNVARTLQQDAGQFYISQLLNYLLSAQPDEPKERFIANIYDLRQFGFIDPL